jgi:2-dehydro-3-deoxyphosphogluconate aldolase/(4S)-4-hydroxy-2-oxoglutarate aldolase
MTRPFLADHPIVPVVVIDDVAAARPLAEALAAGGIHCAEITLRTPEGVEAIAEIAGALPAGFIVGAGTVIHLDQLEAVAEAGARFVVSPGLDRELVERARELGLDVLPGVATASEVQLAARIGLSTVKFFPADRLGGLETIAALAAPFVGMGFVPSGGVTAATMPAYLAHPAVPAVSGSWMVARDLLRAGDMATVESRAKAASDSARAVLDRRTGATS